MLSAQVEMNAPVGRQNGDQKTPTKLKSRAIMKKDIIEIISSKPSRSAVRIILPTILIGMLVVKTEAIL
jgi:hypothetical protein